ncbi:MAG: aminopeptidase P N-terminal domain-containing protein [Bacteroidales bacterium]|nr:aminopeptidase P N-terminal domain-containing protein [Candidatus Cryptobacteroides aphodequi]
MFDKNTYILRRRALLEALKGEKGVAVFFGNTESPAQYADNCYKWRQDSTWLYYFGIDEPRLAATIDLESGQETLYGDDCSLDDIIWNGPTPSTADLAALAGIAHSAPYDAIGPATRGRKLHFVPASRPDNALRIAALTGLAPAAILHQDKNGAPAASLPLVKAIAAQRLIKSEEEIALLDEACVLGQQMHTIARKGVKTGTIEQQIVGDMEGFALAKGWGVSFPTILTQHGEIFHCHSHAQAIEPGKLVLIDAGLESNEHYASDFTRTYPASGRYTQKQRDICQLVCDCNNLAFSLTAPGVAYRDVHIATVTHMLGGLKELGLVCGDPAEMAAEGLGGLFMPHGLGHNMGLDVHDCEDLGENILGYDDDQRRSSQLGLGSLRMARRLKPGNVITDEPGIYFIPALIEQWKASGMGAGQICYDKLESYYDFGGIRIEDDVLVTESGARRLGGERLPASPDEIENAMSNE